jgi:hypothetical protein
MAALTAKRCNDKLRAFAERLHRSGKPFKVVITACMRKLLTILNTPVRSGNLGLHIRSWNRDEEPVFFSLSLDIQHRRFSPSPLGEKGWG